MYYKLGKLVLQIGTTLFYYKLEQTLLQIGAASKLQIRVSAVTNWGNCYKLRHRYYNIGQLLQIGAKFITNCGRYYKLGQLLQIGA